MRICLIVFLLISIPAQAQESLEKHMPECVIQEVIPKVNIDIVFEQPDWHYRAAQIAHITTSTADFAYMWHKTQNPIYSEGNPVYGQTRAQQALAFAAIAGFTAWGSDFVHRRGARGASKVLLWASTAVHVAALIISIKAK